MITNIMTIKKIEPVMIIMKAMHHTNKKRIMSMRTT